MRIIFNIYFYIIFLKSSRRKDEFSIHGFHEHLTKPCLAFELSHNQNQSMEHPSRSIVLFTNKNCTTYQNHKAQILIRPSVRPALVSPTFPSSWPRHPSSVAIVIFIRWPIITHCSVCIDMVWSGQGRGRGRMFVRRKFIDIFPSCRKWYTGHRRMGTK